MESLLANFKISARIASATSLHRQSATVFVRQSQSPSLQLRFQNLIFGLQMLDHRLLLSVQPPVESHNGKCIGRDMLMLNLLPSSPTVFNPPGSSTFWTPRDADRMIFFGERQLQNSVAEFLIYYHGERNHQGIDEQIINPAKSVGSSVGKVRRRERLGGILNYYYRNAA